MKINHKEFYKRQKLELQRYSTNKKSVLNIYAKEIKDELFNLEYKNIEIETSGKILTQLNNLNKSNYDLIIITDVFEVSQDIYSILKLLKSLLNPDGKIIINTINSRWDFILRCFEFLNLKNKNINRSKISRKKFKYIFQSVGLNIQKNYTRQIIPFKLLKIGRVVNTILELIFFRFHLGIKSYFLLKNNSIVSTDLTKSVVIPAKNEEKNLLPLFERLNKLNLNIEYIIICAMSNDNTLNEAHKIKDDFNNLNINVYEQNSNGKANAVFEGFQYCNGDIIAILDSDISVDPEKLIDFFEIIESSDGDFVNGTRMIYPMEKNAMRLLNKIGNSFFQYFISKVIFYDLSDSLCGTKVFKKSSLENLKRWRDEQIIKDPFGDFDMIFNASYEGSSLVELPIHYRSRIYGRTQISRFRDGFKLIIYFLLSFKKLNSSIYE